MTKPERPDKPARKTPAEPPADVASESKSKGGLPPLEVVEPMGKRVLIRKDEDRKTTKSGIHLPDKIEIPTITGRIVAISAQVERDIDYPIARYDRVLFNPKNAIPVDLDADNRLYVIPVEDVVAVIRRESVG
jgi:chaperonin GroES